MQFGTIWKGETLDSRVWSSRFFLFQKVFFSSSFFVEKVWHNGGLFAPKSFTPGECQDLCLQSVGCVGFNWFPNMNCTLFTDLDRDVGKVRGAVRGHPSCKGKGLSAVEAPTRNGKSNFFRTVGRLSPRCGAPLLWRLSRLPPLLPSRLLKVNQDT